MSFLLNAYRNEIKGRDDIKESRVTVSFQSGFDLLDYRNGKIVYAGQNDESSYYSLGFDEGKYVLVIGASGTGKSTWVMQAAANIVAPYENGSIFHDDIENATTETRFRNLSGWTRDEVKNKYFRRNVGITAENFYENIKMIHDLKIKNYKSLAINSGCLGSDGEELEVLPPTVYILDSLALLMPKDLTEEEKLSGQMSATASAKTNAAIFKRIIPLLNRANIILMVINHINEKIDINPMAKTKALFTYLKQNEAIPGGKAPLYLANNLIKIEAASKLEEDSDYGIQGFLTKFTFIKSRTNRSGDTAELVYSPHKGFMNDLSNLHYLRTNKLLNGSGHGYYLDDPADKFKFKEFTDKMKDQDFADKFNTKISEMYSAFIPEMEDIEDEEQYDEDQD